MKTLTHTTKLDSSNNKAKFIAQSVIDLENNNKNSLSEENSTNYAGIPKKINLSEVQPIIPVKK